MFVMSKKHATKHAFKSRTSSCQQYWIEFYPDYFILSFFIGQGDAESVVNAEENPGETCELDDSVDKWHYVKLQILKKYILKFYVKL